MKLLRGLASGCALAVLGLLCLPAHATTHYGELSGVVLDPLGQPQLGASVTVDPEGLSSADSAQKLLTNANGSFDLRKLRPGLYDLKVTQAGFLPTMRQHIHVGAGLTTLVRIEMDSVFSSLDQLRRQPSQTTQADDWKWVLRTSPGTRPILQFHGGAITVANNAPPNSDSSQNQPAMRVEMTAGSRQPGSASALPGSPATAASYDQPLGGIGHILVAGQMSYGEYGGTGETFAGVWLPSGQLDQGSETTVVVRESRFAPGGQTIRAMRAEHSGQIIMGDRLVVDYGAAYVAAGTAGVTAALKPRAKIAARLSPHWTAVASFESEPGSYGLRERTPSPDSALATLDTLPILIWEGNGSSTVADNWHEEVGVRRDLGVHGTIEAAAFHDYSQHTAVFGANDTTSLDSLFASAPFVYAQDGGVSSSWGTRLAYREQLTRNIQVAAIYAWAGALAPDGDSDGQLAQALQMRNRQSVAARVSGKIPRAGTEIAASYKWIDGTVVSRQDLFGEAAFGIDPNLSLVIQQPLPSFGAIGRCHWEAIADFRNLLAQGYVPVNTQQGQLLLVPVLRSFRGGVDFQF